MSSSDYSHPSQQDSNSSYRGALDKPRGWTPLPYFFLAVGGSFALDHALGGARHALMVRAAALGRVL